MEEKSNVDELVYLKQQKDIIEKARESMDKYRQVVEFQRKVITIYNEKWIKMDKSVDSVQEDIDWYVKEYIIPIQEREEELSKLENSLVTIPENHGMIAKVGKFFEKLIPGITKEGRQKRKIEDKKQTIEEEIKTYKTIIKRNPFIIFGANKDTKGLLLERMDISQLDKYSTMKNEPENYLKRNNSVKAIASNIKKDDMINMLITYPALKSEANILVNEFINNGLEAFNTKVGEIARTNNQNRKELVSQINLQEQENDSQDILNRITQQMENLVESLTPEELSEFEKRKAQSKVKDEYKSQEEHK